MAWGQPYADESLSELSACGLPVGEQLMPAQWYERSATQTPEKRLLLAILEDALRCYRGRMGVQGQNFAARRSGRLALAWEAEQWIFSNQPAPFTFDCVCRELGIDPDWLRGCLRKREGEALPLMRSHGVRRKRAKLMGR